MSAGVGRALSLAAGQTGPLKIETSAGNSAVELFVPHRYPAGGLGTVSVTQRSSKQKVVCSFGRELRGTGFKALF